MLPPVLVFHAVPADGDQNQGFQHIQRAVVAPGVIQHPAQQQQRGVVFPVFNVAADLGEIAIPLHSVKGPLVGGQIGKPDGGKGTLIHQAQAAAHGVNIGQQPGDPSLHDFGAELEQQISGLTDAPGGQQRAY